MQCIWSHSGTLRASVGAGETTLSHSAPAGCILKDRIGGPSDTAAPRVANHPPLPSRRSWSHSLVTVNGFTYRRFHGSSEASINSVFVREQTISVDSLIQKINKNSRRCHATGRNAKIGKYSKTSRYTTQDRRISDLMTRRIYRRKQQKYDNGIRLFWLYAIVRQTRRQASVSWQHDPTVVLLSVIVTCTCH